MKRLTAQTCRILIALMQSGDRNRIKMYRVVREMGEEPEKRQGNHAERKKNVLGFGERRDNGLERTFPPGDRRAEARLS